MSEAGSVLRKKLRPRQPSRGRSHKFLDGFAEEMIRRAAKAAHNLDVAVPEFSVDQVERKEAIAAIQEPSLMFYLMTDDERLGLITLDGTVVDALIEQQTLGRVAKAPRGERSVTALDAKLSEAFAKTTLKQMESFLKVPNAPAVLKGYTLGNREDDKAAMTIALEEDHYDILGVSVDLGPGIKTGKVQLWFPAVSETSLALSGGGEVSEELMEIAKELIVPCAACLPPIQVPAKLLVSLEIGAVIPLPRDAMGEVGLKDAKDRSFAIGKLGQLNGLRALRVTQVRGRGQTKGDPASLQGIGEGLNLDPMDANSFGQDANSLPVGEPALAAPMPEMTELPDGLSPEPGLPELPVGDLPEIGAAEGGLPDIGASEGGLPDIGVSEGGLPEMAAAPLDMDFSTNTAEIDLSELEGE